ncbi:Hypothetical protein NCS54_00436300 [Fusarium falciforme]|uniref:Hypothetical protein n=1 Tax=Fusarium falciforme TaxID=195108 RepID=UPI002301DD60|nr:Hypothetical protein NCS54_00436300 [Fusarium falciforme]WAO87068.1 Hypothetical protein NCS54_00436300 [Fusarium falciforme]
MDPLSIFGAVAGGISVTSEIVKALDKAISTASRVKEAPDLAVSTLRDVSMMRLTMVRFQQLLDSQRLDDQRSIYFSLDDAQNVFLGCVTSLDQLENLLRPLSDPRLQSLDISDRLEWAMKDKRINQLAQRVRDAQASLNLMLTIMQHESLIEAREAIADLSEICKRIAPDVAHLKRRSIESIPSIQSSRESVQSDDASTIRPTPPKRPESIAIPTPQSDAPSSRFAFEETLEASRPYRRVPSGVDEVFSYRSSALNMRALSLLSELTRRSLGNMSTMSFVALPIFCNDLSNPQHYTFGDGNDTDKQPAPAIELNKFPSPPPNRPLPPTPYLTPPTTPQSPSPSTKASMWGRLKVMRRPFESETALVYPSSPSLETPLSIRNNIPSMEQLSQLQLKNSEWHLCHGAGGLPCHGAIDMSLCLEFPSEQLYTSQIDLARSKGFLDQFYCKGCESTLAYIVSARRPGWSSFELWCGSEACLSANPDLKPCARYARSIKAGYTIDGFLGYRNLARNEVKCARCFFLCPACEMKRRGVDESSLLQSDQDDIKDEEDAEASDDALCLILDEFLPPRGRTFEYPSTPTTSDSGDSTSQLDQRTQLLQEGWGVSEPSVAIPEENQGALELGRDILSVREETKADWGIRIEYPGVHFHGGHSNPTGSLALAFQTLRSPGLSSEPVTDEDTETMSLPEDAEDEVSGPDDFPPRESFYEELDEIVKESGGI